MILILDYIDISSWRYILIILTIYLWLQNPWWIYVQFFWKQEKQNDKSFHSLEILFSAFLPYLKNIAYS